MKQIARRLSRASRRTTIASLAVMAMAAITAPASWAAFGFEAFETSLDGPQAGQSGGHADFVTDFTVNNHPDANGLPVVDAALKTFVADLPPGLLGNPNATPKCSQFDFFNVPLDPFAPGGCAASTQVGVAEVTLESGPVHVSVFNMEPRNSDETARLGFMIPFALLPIQVGLHVRTESDFGISAVSDGIRQSLPLLRVRMTLWANPGDPSHDPFRYMESLGFLGPALPNPGLPPRPFLSNPTRCGEPLTTRATGIAYGFPDAPAFAQSTMLDPGGLTGCDLVPFQPGLSVTPQSRLVDSPSGFDVELTLPPSDSLETPDQSHLRRAQVTFPNGVSINPSAAQGLLACTDAQLRIGTREPARCPDGAKVGTVEIESPPLPGNGRLIGHVYQRPQLPDETFRVVIVAEGHGVNAKIPGVVRPNESTGQIVALFEETPQVPFTRMTVRLDGGARAVLATPMSCGNAATQGVFAPWSGTADVTRLVSFDTSWDGAGAPCPPRLPFEPVVSAGSRSGAAGSKAPFVFRVQRGDRNQELRSAIVETPPGLSAYLRGVEVCRAAQGDAGTCPESSRVGTATSGAGAGTHPFYLGGKVYLTEGYKGGEYGLSIVVPAIAGPFDLGDVIVRAAIHVDRTTAAIRVESDPIPRILEGVPLRIRDIRVEMDRPGFTVNPTTCERQGIQTRIDSYQGAVSTQTVPMQMGSCARLRFKPRLSLRLTGRRQTATNGHPGVRASLRQPRGQAGIERVQVTLPKALALDPDNAQALCEFADGIKEEPTCPRGSIVGRARAVSPLLNRPLAGNVYFVKRVRRDRRTGNEIRTLPMLVVALRGEIAINLRGLASVKRGRLVSTFRNVPDAPISSFKMRLKGGSNGILVVTDSARGPLDVCSSRQVARVETDAHNGRKYDRDIRVKTPCRRKR